MIGRAAIDEPRNPADSWESIAGRPDYRGALPMPKPEGPLVMPRSIVLEGKYRLLDELGRGAMGTVFRAEDTTLERQVAVKFLLPELVSSQECAQRFRREAVAMAAIRHEHVAQIYAYGDDGGTPYFVMEYLDGETLEQLIDSQNRRGFYIPLDDALDILCQGLSGLAAIHRAGAVHRDIKPANIMLTDNWSRAVIMDFGLTRTVQMDEDTRALAGTPAYIAPELVEGKLGSDRSSLADIYSFGTAAYEVLTGNIPFVGETWVEILQKHITEIPVSPSVRRPGLPEALDEIILRAMGKDPRERYQSCEEMIDDLSQVHKMPLPGERRPSFAPRSRPPGQRRTPSSGRAAVRAFRSTPSGGRGRLLVADADPDFRSLVHSTAKAAVPGCRVHSATDGVMALSLLESLKPHVVLIDLGLPEMNGLEVAAAIRGDDENRHVEIIVVADKGGKREADILRGLGVTRFLTKPVDQDTLADLLRPLLERNLSATRSHPPTLSP
jgi:eukaryotic-like serine/threonine-protein kinase